MLWKSRKQRKKSSSLFNGKALERRLMRGRTEVKTRGKIRKEKSFTIKKSSPVYKLDSALIDGLMCVGGWLRGVPIPDQAKNQVILPKKPRLKSACLILPFVVRTIRPGACPVLSSKRFGYFKEGQL